MRLMLLIGIEFSMSAVLHFSLTVHIALTCKIDYSDSAFFHTKTFILIIISIKVTPAYISFGIRENKFLYHLYI